MKAPCSSVAVAATVILTLSACGGGGSDDEPAPPPSAQPAVPAPAPAPSEPAPNEPPEEAAPKPVSCPAAIPSTASCLSGLDSKGAYYLIAKPAAWNGKLVLHAHGGPSLDAPTEDRAVEDLTRWAVMVEAGYAWAGSTFRQGGVEVRAAAEDTERLRGIFRQYVGKPARTILHGLQRPSVSNPTTAYCSPAAFWREARAPTISGPTCASSTSTCVTTILGPPRAATH
jgi:hypothetical protein